MKQFGEISPWIDGLSADGLSALVAATSDVALIIDADGYVKAVGFDDDVLAFDECAVWSGNLWTDTVTVESRQKVEDLLADATNQAVPRWRHINQISPNGDIPILFAIVGLDKSGAALAVGRDLRATASLQQRLIEAQQLLEADHARLRNLDTRYRLLEQMTTDGVLLLDAASQKIVEANPIASSLLTSGTSDLSGKNFSQDFDFLDIAAVEAFLEAVQTNGAQHNTKLAMKSANDPIVASGASFRAGGRNQLLIRLSQPTLPHSPASSRSTQAFAEVAENGPDAFVVTAADGRVIDANPAFLDMLQFSRLDQVKGESLDTWLGRPGVDMSVLLAALKERGSIRLFATTIKSQFTDASDIEISAVALKNSDPGKYGFLIRSVGQRLAPANAVQTALPRSVEQMTELVGRVSLKELVKETTEVIERMCIETALDMTGNNRASAAEMLGLSRQILYVKLRRYGLLNAGTSSDKNSA